MMNVCLVSCGTLSLLLIVLAAIGSLGPRHHHHNRAAPPALPSIVARGALVVDASTAVATVDVNFVCATIDWWPREKCNYGSCSWPHSSILNLDLESPLLREAVTALSPLLIRLGGSLQDQIVYDVTEQSSNCEPLSFVQSASSRYAFSAGCLNLSRWQQLNEFFQSTGSLVAFGLNALHGRRRAGDHFQGSWNSSNVRQLISYSVSRGYPIKAWELGNELSNGIGGARLYPDQYAADVDQLQSVIDEIYGTGPKPVIVAPDGFFNAQYYSEVLRQSRSEDPNSRAISVHVYNLGPGNGKDIAARILSAPFNNIYQQVQDVLSRNGGGAKAWVGEAGGIYNGGQHLVSDTFVFSFWYLDQLGLAALHNTQVFCRQSLIGGNYGLLDSNFSPNPDFYSALLWTRLMGGVVLNVTSQGAVSNLHAYSHCLKSSKGGIAVLVLNFSNDTEVILDLEPKLQKLEYHLSSADGSVHSKRVALNGRILRGAGIELMPLTVDPSQPSKVAPLSIAFITLPDAFLPACAL